MQACMHTSIHTSIHPYIHPKTHYVVTHFVTPLHIMYMYPSTLCICVMYMYSTGCFPIMYMYSTSSRIHIHIHNTGCFLHIAKHTASCYLSMPRVTSCLESTYIMCKGITKWYRIFRISQNTPLRVTFVKFPAYFPGNHDRVTLTHILKSQCSSTFTL